MSSWQLRVKRWRNSLHLQRDGAAKPAFKNLNLGKERVFCGHFWNLSLSLWCFGLKGLLILNNALPLKHCKIRVTLHRRFKCVCRGDILIYILEKASLSGRTDCQPHNSDLLSFSPTILIMFHAAWVSAQLSTLPLSKKRCCFKINSSIHCKEAADT